MSTSISAEERLLNLVFALINTTTPMTRAQIARTVAGYAPDASIETQERMFERDKVTLRELGVPLITSEHAAHATEIGYRIDKDSYALGELNLSATEFSILSLAATLWQGNTALAAHSSQAMTKLASGFQGSPDADAVAGLAPRLAEPTGNVDPLIVAITENKTVQFTYRTARTDKLMSRTVAPWRVALRRGAWYLVGYDLDRKAPRVFRLSRFESKVKTVRGVPYEVPDGLDIDTLLGQASDGAGERALLAIRAERALTLRLRGRVATPVTYENQVTRLPADFDLCEVPFTSVVRFSEEIVAYGEAVLVLDPPELRAAVLDRLRAAAALAIQDGEEEIRG